MRRLLGCCARTRPSPLAPQPGLADLPLLVAQVARGGARGRRSRWTATARLPLGYRALRVPDRAGGVHQRAEARRRRRCVCSRAVRRGRDSSSRSSTTAMGGTRRNASAVTGSSGCASALRSTAARSKPAGVTEAATSCGRSCRPDDNGSDRRRSGAGPRRVTQDPGGRQTTSKSSPRRRTATRRSRPRRGTAPIWC